MPEFLANITSIIGDELLSTLANSHVNHSMLPMCQEGFWVDNLATQL